jgi:ABC-type transport system involved in cytochrome c biogenesis permease subunit
MLAITFQGKIPKIGKEAIVAAAGYIKAFSIFTELKYRFIGILILLLIGFIILGIKESIQSFNLAN